MDKQIVIKLTDLKDKVQGQARRRLEHALLIHVQRVACAISPHHLRPFTSGSLVRPVKHSVSLNASGRTATLHADEAVRPPRVFDRSLDHVWVGSSYSH